MKKQNHTEKNTVSMHIKRSRGEKIFDTCNVIFMLFLAAIMVLPMLHVWNVSISEGTESLKGGFFFLPKGKFNFDGYMTVLKDPSIVKAYAYTILYSAGGVVFTCFFTALTAYPLSISGFCLKKPVTIFLTITMFIGGGMIPTYLLMKDLHLTNTIWVMLLPFCVGAYNVILFRTFFSNLPPALREAAIIDGASEFQIFTRIFIPLSKAIFATISLFTFVGKWNDWFNALIYLNEEKYPMQMILRRILYNTTSVQNMDSATRDMMSSMKVTAENIKMAAIIITIFPILCIYPFIQKYFVKGVFVGTVKG